MIRAIGSIGGMMAKLIPPEKVIRLKNKSIYGQKWHFIETERRRLTVCKIVLVGSQPNPPKWDVSGLEDVKPKDICKMCLGGMVAV